MQTHVIQLERYCAKAEGVRGRLVLGTWDSYGLEQLQLVLGDGWDGRTVTAIFHGPKASTGTTVLAGSDGLVDVPQEATAAAGYGTITIVGVDADSQRISVDVPYMVMSHAPITGQQPDPTPNQWQQFVAAVKADADRAEREAGDAADSAAAAAKSAEAAGESAQKAEQAGADIGEAKDAALQAIQQAQDTGVQAVQAATTTGVQAVQQAHQAALDDIATDRQQALADIEETGYKQTAAITSGGAAALEAIGRTEQAAIGQVQQAGTAQVAAIETAGAGQLDKINAANALVPTPTEADAGKAVVVMANGSGYELGDIVADAYTKAESDARYAPIETAIKVSGSGTGMVSLSPTVAWGMQGLTLYGRSWQDGTPSVEQEAPIQSAGQSGTVDVTVAGANLIPRPYYDGNWKTSNGVTFSVNDDGSVKVVGTATRQTCFNISANRPGKRIVLPPGEYIETFLGNGVMATATAINKSTGIERSVGANVPFTLDKDEELNTFIFVEEGVTVNTTAYVMLSSGDTAQPYQPYTEQQLPIPTTDGLPGIPVAVGGNWTDENGQQWVSDVVDFEAGTKTQKVYKWMLENIPKNSRLSDLGSVIRLVCPLPEKSFYVEKYKFGLCNILEWDRNYNTDNAGWYYDTNLVFKIPKTALETYDYAGIVKFLTNSGAYILYCLSTPITTTLDAETVAAYKALQSYPGTTNVLAPDAGIEASALAEPNQWVQEQIQAAVTQAVTQAVAITGGNT